MTTRMRTIIQTPEGREEWLGWRKGNINASEAGALLGVDKYRTPLALYYEKFGDLATEETEAMRRGRWLEPAVIKAVAETRPDWEVIPRTEYFDDPELRVGCTPDAFITDKQGRKGVLQAKTVNRFAFQAWCADGDIKAPLAYEVQTVAEAVQTLRMDFAVLGVLIVGNGPLSSGDIELKVLPVPVHEGAWETFLKRAKSFWSDAAKGISPPVTEPDADLIKRLYPMPDGSTIDLSQDKELALLLERLQGYSEIVSAGNKKLKPFEEKRDAIRTQLKAKMGAAEVAILPNGKMATLKLVEPKPSAYRKLHIKEIKG